MAKQKRTYTFRQGQPLPYESGSLIHEMEKEGRETHRRAKRLLDDL